MKSIDVHYQAAVFVSVAINSSVAWNILLLFSNEENNCLSKLDPVKTSASFEVAGINMNHQSPVLTAVIHTS